MKSAPIFFMAGAPAVGKSTTAHALAGRFPKSIHIPVDDLREMVVTGIIRPAAAWSDDLIEQLSLARASAIQMALNYNQAGFVVVIDDFWDPNSLLNEYAPLFEKPNAHKILLFPNQRATQARNLARSGPGDSSIYIAEGIRLVYEHLDAHAAILEQQGWLLVDSSEKNLEETVNHILAQTS